MKYAVMTGLAALSLTTVACDKSTSSNPATVLRSDLNSPNGLVTVTGNKQIELLWLTGNAEKDFKGYHVFAVAKAKADVPAPAYPAGATLDEGIPRCVANTTTFEAFGFTPSTADCKGGDAATPATASTGTTLVDTAAAATTDKIVNAVPCQGNSDTTISLPVADGTSLKQQTCVVTKAWDPTTKALVDIANGTTYTFFVTAVSGDDKSTISWTSNFVQDTPSTPLYTGKIAIDVGDFYMIPGAKIQALTALVDADLTSGSCSPDNLSICTVNQTNAEATLGLYFGRLGGGNFPQRVFLSVPKDGAIGIQLRGPQTLDPTKPKELSTSIPGDHAVDTTYLTGIQFPIYGNEVFDIKSTVAGKVNYGKLVIGQPTTTAGDTDGTKPLTIPITIIMQPKVGSFDYFR